MIEILDPGLLSTIQDSGRIGFRNLGVPISGFMDSEAARMANLIVGNPENSALIEITLHGPKLRFHGVTQMAITGANLSPEIDHSAIPMNQLITVNDNSVLSFGKPVDGVRSYLAIKGGILSDNVLNSQSQFRHITYKHKLERGDMIDIGVASTSEIFKMRLEYSYKKNSDVLEAYPGPEFESLDKNHINTLLASKFQIGLNDRMGYQLESSLTNSVDPIISSAVLPGTVQLTPSGKLLVLMRDCQTTGGYPRVLQLSESAINNLSQKRQNESVRFRLITSDLNAFSGNN